MANVEKYYLAFYAKRCKVATINMCFKHAGKTRRPGHVWVVFMRRIATSYSRLFYWNNHIYILIYYTTNIIYYLSNTCFYVNRSLMVYRVQCSHLIGQSEVIFDTLPPYCYVNDKLLANIGCSNLRSPYPNS